MLVLCVERVCVVTFGHAIVVPKVIVSHVRTRSFVVLSLVRRFDHFLHTMLVFQGKSLRFSGYQIAYTILGMVFAFTTCMSSQY